MYCKYCGKEIDDKAYICVHCGSKVAEDNKVTVKSGRGLGIAGIICSTLIPLATYICSGIGLSRAKKGNDKGTMVLNILAISFAVVTHIFNILNMNFSQFTFY